MPLPNEKPVFNPLETMRQRAAEARGESPASPASQDSGDIDRFAAGMPGHLRTGPTGTDHPVGAPVGPPGLELSQPERRRTPEHAESDEAGLIYQMKLGDAVKGTDGLVWKPVCKTGVLALSPGPGQVDVEKPLVLDSKLLHDLKRSVDEQAFPHITVPETHNNGVLENTGYVRKTEIKKNQDGEEELWAGIDFTEPDVRDRALRGSIPDTSVGVKFNYRNKRSGEKYDAALEHVALTPQPWVDGLSGFQEQMLSQEPYDQSAESDWRGVFIDAPDRGNILPEEDESGRLPSKMARTKTRKPAARRQGGTTVEELLASQQAQIEELQGRATSAERELALAQGTISSQSEQLHADTVNQEIRDYQEAGIPTAVLREARDIMLADKPGNDAGTLKLSVQTEDGIEEEEELRPSDIVRRLLSQVPTTFPTGDVEQVALDLDQHGAARKPAEKDVTEKADEIERELHPERFDSDGKRIESEAVSS